MSAENASIKKHYLVSWEPRTGAEETAEVASALEIAGAAGDLLARYREAGHLFPGLEIQANRTEVGNSISVAVAPFGWAIYVTDENFDQKCTVGTLERTGNNPEFCWEQPTQVPFRQFIPEQVALECIERWMIDKELADITDWSDDCA